MWRSFFTDKKWLLWSWGGFAFIILSLLAQTYIDVKINEWYKGFYDLLQKAPERELSEFYDGIYLFMKLAIPYVIIYTITNYFTRLWAFRWREAMTFSYMPYWRAVDATVEGASQRIQEDAMNFAKIVESLKKHLLVVFEKSSCWFFDEKENLFNCRWEYFEIICV